MLMFRYLLGVFSGSPHAPARVHVACRRRGGNMAADSTVQRPVGFFGTGTPAPLYFAAGKETVMAEKGVSIAYADGTGSFLVLLAMAEQQGLFGKYGVEVRSVAVKGATVPRLTADMPLGMIGEPAALLQTAEGADLRLVASFSDIKLSGHLVARPGIKNPEDLRGKRLGARVIGAGLWISTILALEQLALDPQRDEITILPVGNPVQIFRALEQGEIDGALVSAAQSPNCRPKGLQSS